MYFYLHYLVFAPLLLLVLLAVTLPTRRPDRVLGRALLQLVTTRGGRLVLCGYLFVVVTNLVQGLFDVRLTAALGYDLTPRVLELEGELVARLQDWILGLPAGDTWIAILALCYTAGYVAWLLFPPVALSALGNRRAAGAFGLAFTLNYLFALPFYLFAPVQEVAWSGLSRARPLLEEHWPGITPHLRLESALDNCFPSLHVSIAVTSLYFVLRHAPRRFALVAWPLTLAICLSVLALGIHWTADTLVGIPFGLFCAFVAERILKPGRPGEGPGLPA